MPTAMEIYKMLPRKNCGECKLPTCLAFAMQLANKKVSLEDCPYVDESAKATLEESGAPPIRLVKFGAGAGELELGGETELFRHDKKFYHPTVLALLLRDSMPEGEQESMIAQAKALEYDRVGQKMRLDALALRCDSRDADAFASLVERAMKGCDLPIILLTDDPECLRSAVTKCKDRRPIIGTARPGTLEGFAALAKEHSLPLCVSADGLDDLSELSTKCKQEGLQDIILEVTRADLGKQLEDLTIVRRMAVKANFRPLGSPTLMDATVGGDELIKAALGIAKYASIVLLDTADPALLYPLMTFRQNIFTDPQVPLQVEEKVYDIGSPKPESPFLMTTNFSLTYFTVAGDIEKSGVASRLLVVNTEGLSVMTAFAAGKLTAEGVAKLVDDLKIGEQSSFGGIIIPGMVSRMSGKLEELTGLKVIVGPRESSALPKFLKSLPR